MTRRKMRKPKKAKRAILPHGAYCMTVGFADCSSPLATGMIRSFYDLYPKRKRKTW